jgi:hypothetical protein
MSRRFRYAPVLLLLSVALTVGACEEKLPAYEVPEFQLQAAIYVEIPLDLTEGGPNRTFGVDVTNVTGIQNPAEQYVLLPPYEISATVSISLVRDPSRRVDVSGSDLFDDPVADRLDPGRIRRLVLPFPMEDSYGRGWNWPLADESEYELVLQGTVEIEEAGVTIHTPPVRTSLIYP